MGGDSAEQFVLSPAEGDKCQEVAHRDDDRRGGDRRGVRVFADHPLLSHDIHGTPGSRRILIGSAC